MAQKRTIRYLPKTTTAKTEYREITEEDLGWITQEILRWIVTFGDNLHDPNPDMEWAVKEFWLKRRRNLHKGQHGMNSPYSLCAGVLSNFMFKTPPQRDLSARQCEDLEMISGLLADAFPQCTAMKFSQSLFE